VTFTAPAGTSEFVKRWNPKPGDIATFKHNGFLLSNKKPKSPSLYRMRPEVTWEDVVASFKEQTPRTSTRNSPPFSIAAAAESILTLTQYL